MSNIHVAMEICYKNSTENLQQKVYFYGLPQRPNFDLFLVLIQDVLIKLE